MPETFYRTGIYKVNYSEYGGRICVSDFDKKTTLSDIASRIVCDQKFNEQCRKNILNRQIYGGKENA